MLILTMAAGSGPASVFRLSEGRTHRIGRRQGEVALEDNRVSRRHAELTCQDGQWTVRDLDSANGTFVNSAQVEQSTPIHNGDRLEVGRHIFDCAIGSAEDTLVGAAPAAAAADRFEQTLERRLDELQHALQTPSTDLEHKLDALEDKLDQLRDAPEARADDQLGRKLDEIRAAILDRPDHEIEQKLNTLLEASRTEPDRALEDRLGELQHALEALPDSVEHKLAPEIERRLGTLQRTLETQPDPADRETLDQILTAVRRRTAETEEDEQRLARMETRLGELTAQESEAGPLLHRLIGAVEAGRHADPAPFLDRLHERLETLTERTAAQERAFDELFAVLRVIREHQDQLDRAMGRLALEQAVPAQLSPAADDHAGLLAAERSHLLRRPSARPNRRGPRMGGRSVGGRSAVGGGFGIAAAAAVAILVPALVLASVNAWSGRPQSDSFLQMWHALTGQTTTAPTQTPTIP